ncbi:MAG: hypothetical protein WBY53_00130 [Acidobacteriaceae bacterium]
MKLLKHASLVVALAAGFFTLCATPSLAQNKIEFLGTFAKPGVVAPNAAAEYKVFAAVARKYPTRASQWTWVIVLDDAMWHRLMVNMGFPDDPMTTYYGQTDLQGHITYIRGWTLLHPDQPSASPDRVISYEMAQVYLHSEDQTLIAHTAQAWMKAPPARPAPSGIEMAQSVAGR